MYRYTKESKEYTSKLENQVRVLRDHEDVTYLRIQIIQIRRHIARSHAADNPNITKLVNMCLDFKKKKNLLLRFWNGTVPEHARGMGEVIEFSDIVDGFLDELKIGSSTPSANKVITDRQYLINNLR